MPSLETLNTVVLATNNLGKVEEMQSMLAHLNWHLIPQSEFNTPDIEETGLSFVENSILKARNAAKYSGLPSLADDSGLEVHALNGAPGIFSARYSGDQATDDSNNNLLLERMAQIPKLKRMANFRCCLALVRHQYDPCPLIAEGIWSGQIAFKQKGSYGFGYDPLFIVNDLNKHSAELSPQEKNTISHRAKAIEIFCKKVS